MKPEDQVAFEVFVRDHCDYLDLEVQDIIYMRDSWQAALAHRDAQASAINEQLLEALRPFAEFDLRGDNIGNREDNQPVYARDKTVLTVGDFKRAKAAIAHRDAQASAINEQMLKALKQLLRCPAIVDGDLNSFDWGCPETAEAVSHAEKAIAAAEAHKEPKC